MYWGRLSDRIGRRPVLLIGLAGLAASMLSLGFARSFPAIVFSRVIAGVLSGNVGVTKSMVSLCTNTDSPVAEACGAKIAELSNESNRARLYAFITMAWIIGCIISEYLPSTDVVFLARVPFASHFWPHRVMFKLSFQYHQTLNEHNIL